MLAEPRDEAFTRDGWVFELKLDGYRLLASKTSGEALLLTRNGNDYTAVFPEVARAMKALPVRRMHHRRRGRRARRRRASRASRACSGAAASRSPIEIKRAAVELPATFYRVRSAGLRGLRPASARRSSSARRCCIERGPEARRRARARPHRARGRSVPRAGRPRWASKGSSPRRPTRRIAPGAATDWLKIKAEPTGDFVDRRLHGAERQSRSHRRAAARRHGRRHSSSTRAASARGSTTRCSASSVAARSDRAEDPPCLGPCVAPGAEPLPATEIPETKTTTWVEPRARVRGAVSRVDAGRLAAPRGVPAPARRQERRDDCVRQRLDVAGDHAIERATELPTPRRRRARSAPTASSRRVTNEPPPPAAGQPTSRRPSPSPISRKIYWPADGYTKGDLIDYYRAVSPWMLPYLRNRPLVLTRFPDGIDGKSFYQKDAPEFAPKWMRTDPIWSEDTQRDDQLLRLRRRRVAALHRQPRLDSAAHLGESRRVARAARLVRDRPRSEGGAVLRRDPHARWCCTGCARRSACRTT